MKRIILLAFSLSMAGVPPSSAGTFSRSPIAPDQGIDAFTRGAARSQVGRDLFGNPYATVTLANIDLHDRFPYVESRTFQVVSDPRWNRLVYGEAGRSLRAYDGVGAALGRLEAPRGMAVDERNRVYVADTGNDRVVVLEAVTQFGEVTLEPRFAIGGLGGPYDVAYSDGGTPFVDGDDHLYVAETGKNRVAALELGASSARVVARVGDLGSGAGRFAGPTALAIGRARGASTRDVYVADAHNRRLVHLRHGARGLEWVAEAPAHADLLTSLETDEWGNLYAAAPQQGVVRKFSPSLEPVAALQGAVARPKNFHIAFANVRDHRNGTATRHGTANAVSLDQWSDDSGLSLWSLGVQVEGLGVRGGAVPAACFTLTDHADVTLEIRDAASGRLLARREPSPLEAGAHALALGAEELAAAGESGDLILRVSAAPGYENAAPVSAATSFRLAGGSALMVSARPVLVGNWPNPVTSATRIGFVLPSGGAKAELGLYDAQGRRVKRLGGGFAAGWNEVSWDGTDEGGRALQPGAYFYRLDVGAERFTRTLMLVR